MSMFCEKINAIIKRMAKEAVQDERIFRFKLHFKICSKKCVYML